MGHRKILFLSFLLFAFLFLCACSKSSNTNIKSGSTLNEESPGFRLFPIEEVMEESTTFLDYGKEWAFYVKTDGTLVQLMYTHTDEGVEHEGILDTLKITYLSSLDDAAGLKPFENMMGCDGFIFKYESEEGGCVFDFYRVMNDEITKIASCKGDMYHMDLDNDGQTEIICSNGASGHFNLFWVDENSQAYECYLNETTREFLGLSSLSHLTLNIPTERAAIMTFFPDHAELNFENVDWPSVFLFEKIRVASHGDVGRKLDSNLM